MFHLFWAIQPAVIVTHLAEYAFISIVIQDLLLVQSQSLVLDTYPKLGHTKESSICVIVQVMLLFAEWILVRSL